MVLGSPLTFAASGTNSSMSKNRGVGRLVGLIFSAGWTAATVAFEIVSGDPEASSPTYVTLRNEANAAIALPSITASSFVALGETTYNFGFPIENFRIVAGTAQAAANSVIPVFEEKV